MLMDDALCVYCEQNDAGDFLVEGAKGPCCFGSPKLPGCFDIAQLIGWEQMNQDLDFRKRWNKTMAACRKKGSLEKPHRCHIPGIHLVQLYRGFVDVGHISVILRISSFI